MTHTTSSRETQQQPTTLLRAAGFSYFPVALLARLPYAMMVVGVLTLVVSARGELSLGGLTSAMVGVGTAIFGPLIGAAADRVGQRGVVLAAGIANSVALLAMAWVAFSSSPDFVVLIVAFVIGATAPQVSPMSRSRLVGIIASRLPGDRHAAVLNGTMAYESAADEIVFVFGPFIVGLLATTLNPAAPIVGAAVLTVVFVSAFALHRSGAVRPATDGGLPVQQAPARELFRPGLLAVTVGVLGMGLFFGSMLTALTSFLSDFGHPEQAGLIYGVMGVGSAALALGVAWFPLRFSLRWRWLTFAGLLAASTIALPFATTVPGVILVLLIAGFGVGPTLVTQYSFGAERSPIGRSATVMTILGSAVIVGQSASSALVGALAQSAGTHVAMYAPLVSALVVLLAGVANVFITGRRPR
ncbi:MFS transporter [Leifsonia shinshuensis]|uniref:MFS transporter n=1 Tax=Leifsonia shinshuensis TaxID=150026 RepID=UPI001F509FF7|nr:MFS transporter [Leifsonia shinshuensis]MCI0156587.1 MFS transporter [Leifsonia shinshuensis]